MIFTNTIVQGAPFIDLERRADQRGFFARAWCRREFEAQGLNARMVQVNISQNVHKGTLRGMHFQAEPHGEAKIVSCTKGAIYDVVLDVRPNSPSFLKWAAVKLDADNHRMLFIPEGCAHGFQSLTDDAEVLYLMSEYYSSEHSRGLRHDDPAFGIDWPLAVTSISDADRSWPSFDPHALAHAGT
ncbi:MAG: dTDP-4-dehydrorhamnose 3,5-epimerase [Planctomycetes bacterium]|nr:dTDP-4-dehydrorhamnose 3,5-epimerase [Planctomycetota bacterium]